MDISEYISITRTVSDNPAHEPLYKGYYARILGAFQNPDQLPELKVVYTLQRSTETIILSGNEYLIYDQYLGQTMNMLNRILFNSDTPMDSEMYAFKLLAERYAMGGQFMLAALLAYSYHMMRDKYTSYKKEKNFRRRTTFTFYQELFIIAHEIAHLVIRDPGRFLSTSLRDSGNSKSLNQDEGYRTLIQTMSEHFGLGEVIYEVFDRSANSLAAILLQDARFNHSSDIREECCCDVLATIMVISILKQDDDFDLSDVLIAIAMCLRHLRILGIVSAIYSGAWFEERTERNLWVHDLVLRTSNIREFLLATSKASVEGLELGRGNELVQMADHYEEVIDDPVMLSVTQKITGILKLRETSESTDPGPEFTLRDIGEVTGFFRGSSL